LRHPDGTQRVDLLFQRGKGRTCAKIDAYSDSDWTVMRWKERVPLDIGLVSYMPLYRGAKRTKM